MKEQNKNCHNCKKFVNTTLPDDLFVCGNCNLLNIIILDADNEKCKYFIDKLDKN